MFVILLKYGTIGINHAEGLFMQIRTVTDSDIPQWLELSAEYDPYVKESVSDLSEWYGGNETSPAYDFYMRSKISQREAFMAVDNADNCLGIIAFSKKNNRITFFAVSHCADFPVVADALFCRAFGLLDISKPVFISEIISAADWMRLHHEFYRNLGFAFYSDTIENGVPVKTLVKLPSSYEPKQSS